MREGLGTVNSKYEPLQTYFWTSFCFRECCFYVLMFFSFCYFNRLNPSFDTAFLSRVLLNMVVFVTMDYILVLDNKDTFPQ